MHGLRVEEDRATIAEPESDAVHRVAVAVLVLLQIDYGDVTTGELEAPAGAQPRRRDNCAAARAVEDA